MSSSNFTALSIFSNYARDIERHWKYKECQRKVFSFKSPQLALRNLLVEWIKSVSDNLTVSYRTVHLAMYILDTFMDNHSIAKDRLGFVALVCLMLAVKFEEPDSKIPKISELNKYDGYRYSNKEFISVEVMILKFLDFGLTQPTVAHFAEFYGIATVLPCDLKASRVSFRHLGETASKIVTEFLHICLKETRLLQFLPSQVAAACVLATRRQLNLFPAWPSILAEMTGYAEESLNYCVNLLMRKVDQENIRKKRSLHSPDLGYISDTP